MRPFAEKLRLLESLSFDEQEDELERAQMAKIDAMIERAQLRPAYMPKWYTQMSFQHIGSLHSRALADKVALKQVQTNDAP
eukprot:6177023-Pleurochrysis_carterae.AAC.1